MEIIFSLKEANALGEFKNGDIYIYLPDIYKESLNINKEFRELWAIGNIKITVAHEIMHKLIREENIPWSLGEEIILEEMDL